MHTALPTVTTSQLPAALGYPTFPNRFSTAAHISSKQLKDVYKLSFSAGISGHLSSLKVQTDLSITVGISGAI